MSSVTLHFEALGNSGNPPLIVLHGLLGSARNWLSVGKVLTELFDVYLLDLRNHGSSPHTDSMDYDEMVEDLLDWVNTHNIKKFYLLGHSLGGKVAMTFACRYPERLLGLIIEDIVPKEYNLRYVNEFKAMNALSLASIKNRAEADKAMELTIPDWTWRQFILTNLKHNIEAKSFHWQINLPVLTEWLTEIMKNPLKQEDQFKGPTLFFRGENSDFIANEDYQTVYQHFPNATIMEFPHTGHNIHVENTSGFFDALKKLL